MSKQLKKSKQSEKKLLQASDVTGTKYLKNILALLKPLHEHCDCHNRKFHYDEYIAYLLLYFFNPVLTSMRGIQQVSNIESITKKLKLPRFSLGSFSESGRVFDPELLAPIIKQLSDAVTAVPHKVDPGKLALTAVDGTLLHAIPKMVWALWVDEQHRSAKMHLQYDILKGVPVEASVTDAVTSEKTILRENLSANKLYVLDRGYACYQLLADIIDTGSSFVARILNHAKYECVEDRPISDSAQHAGVRKDMLVSLGSAGYTALKQRKIRLVEIYVPDKPEVPGETRSNRTRSKTKTFRSRSTEQTILLATDLLDLDAEVIGEMYRSRWQIEIFFRWFKKVLQANHPLSLSKNGLTITIYCALIASLLVVLWTGRKPTKRTYEMLCLYFMGWVEDDELIRHLEQLKKID